jgi:hypothetical protein
MSTEQVSEPSKPKKTKKLRANAPSGSSQLPDSASFGDATDTSKSRATAGALSLMILNVSANQFLTHILMLVPTPTDTSSGKVLCPHDNCDRLYAPSKNALRDHRKDWHRSVQCDLCTFSGDIGRRGLGHHKTEAHTLVLCQCGDECAGTEELERHDQRAHPERGPFDCRRKGCDKKYNSSKRIHWHTLEVHDPVPCPRCGVKVDGEANLDVHKRSHGDFGRYDCRREGCGALYGSASGLTVHNHEVHDPVPCPRCGVKFDGEANLDVHKRSHGDFGRYDCRRKGCGAQYDSTFGLRLHNREVHNPVSCDRCGPGVEFDGGANFDDHTRSVHGDFGRYDCRREGCGALYGSPQSLTLHTLEVHDPVPCPRCGVKVDGEANLDVHKRSHGDFGRYDCRREGCGAQYGSTFGLWLHNHEVHNPVSCDRCGPGVEFDGGANLDDHTRSIHGDFGRYDCRREGCGALYGSASGLTLHNHELHDPVPCPRCGVKFNGEANLDVHKRSHGDFGRYDCRREGCGAQYDSTFGLRLHNREVHNPVSCDRCGPGVEFDGGANLDAHKRSVHGDFGRYDCRHQGCGARYSRAANLAIHEEYHAGTRMLVRPPQRISSAPALVPRVRSANSNPDRPTRSYSDAARSVVRSSAVTASSIRRPIPFNTSTPTLAQIPQTILLACTIRWVLEQRDAYDVYIEFQAFSSTPVSATTPVSSYMRIQEKIRQAIITCTSDIRWEEINNAPIVASMHPGLDRQFSALKMTITSTAPDDMGEPSSGATDATSGAAKSDIKAGRKFQHAWTDLKKQHDFSRVLVDALDTFPELFQHSTDGRPGLLDLIEVHQHMTETIASDDLRLSTPYSVSNYHNGLILLFRVLSIVRVGDDALRRADAPYRLP